MTLASHFLFWSLSLPIWQVGMYQVMWSKGPNDNSLAQGGFVVLTRVVVAGEDDSDNSRLTWASGGYVPSWSNSVNGVVGGSDRSSRYSLSLAGHTTLVKPWSFPNLQVCLEGAPGATVLGGLQG